MKSYISLLLAFLIGCSGGGDDSNSQQTSSAKLVILNQMTTTGKVIDGVEMSRLEGSNSSGGEDVIIDFDAPVAFGQSVTISLPKCDVYWDLKPFSNDVPEMFGNFGKDVFIPCDETTDCKAIIKSGLGMYFGDLEF